MGNGQPTKTGSASGSKADSSEGSVKLPPSESMPLGASGNLSTTTTATMPKGSRKTLTSAKLQELRSKAGLVAGALADFQAAGGLVVKKKIDYSLPSGTKFSALKLYLIVDGADIVAVQTEDGLELDVVAG